MRFDGKRTAAAVPWQLMTTLPREGSPVMAVTVYLDPASAGNGEITYDDADAFSITSGGFLLIQRQHSGAQKDLAVFAPNVWRHAEIVQERGQGSK
jgi:hypothetical protein